MPNWRGLLTDNKRQRLKMKKQRISPNQDQTHHFKQNLKQTQKQSTDQKKLPNKGKPWHLQEMARLSGCNPRQTGDGASDDLENCANWRDCQG